MQVPPRITFKNMPPSKAIETDVLTRIGKLETYYDRILSCRVVVEVASRHRERGHRYNVRIILEVPGRQIAVTHEPTLYSQQQDLAIEKRTKEIEVDAQYRDLYVSLRDAFDEVRRQLQDYARRRRGQVKNHEPQM